MQTCFHRDRATLERAVRAAIAAHRPEVLRTLLGRSGSALFARTLGGLNARVRDDALSLLSLESRAAVERHLPACQGSGSGWRAFFLQLGLR